MDNFPRTAEGLIIETEFSPDFKRQLEKKRRLNRTGEDVYMDKRGWISRDEDKIIAAQRIWKEIAYAPGGIMYQRTMERWNTRAEKSITM